MDTAHGVIQHAPGHLREPVIDGPHHDQDRRHTHHHVEMADDEVGVGKGQIHGDVAQEQSSEAAVDEREDKANGEEHRHVEPDVALPECQNPVVHLDRRGDGNDERGGGEEKAEIRVHATDVHVVGPDDEAQTADCHDGPDHHPIAKNILSSVGAE